MDVDGFAVEMLSYPIDSKLKSNVFSSHGRNNVRLTAGFRTEKVEEAVEDDTSLHF